jgi:hypothetical protein
MSEGFNDDTINVRVYNDEVKKLLKEYKKVKKYMRSSIFEIKKIDGTETYVSKLMEEGKDG